MDAAEIKTLIEAHVSSWEFDQAESGDGYPTTPHIVNLLTGSYGTVPNPVAAQLVPKPITAVDLMAAAPIAMTRVSDGMLIEIGKRRDAQDRQWIGGMAVVLNKRKIDDSNDVQMPDEELVAVQALLTATIPDPNWPAEVPAPSLVSGIECDSLTKLINEALGRSADGN